MIETAVKQNGRRRGGPERARYPLACGSAIELRGAKQIGNHLKTDDVGQLIEDALASRAKELGLVGKKAADR